MIEIGVLLADSGGELAERFLALQEEMRVHIRIVYHVTENSLREDIEGLIKNYGVEVLICRNPLSFFVKKAAKLPVVTLDVASEDIVRAVLGFKHPIRSFAFYFYRSDEEKYSRIRKELEKMTGCKVLLPGLNYDQGYSYSALENIFDAELKDCDAVVTGTTMVADLFEFHGKWAIPLSAEWYRIREAINDAISNALLYRREKYQLALSEWALDSTKGYFIMAQNGKIIMVNDSLCLLLKKQKNEILGMDVDAFWQIHALLKKMRNAHFHGLLSYTGADYIIDFKQKKFSAHGDEISVYTLQNVKDVQSAEYKVRRELTRTGYEARWHFEDIIMKNRNMQKLIVKAKKYAHVRANILITGESGTGKELLAQSIHNESAFADGPFVAVNCSAIPENLLESELFGYEEGAFTGARKGGKIGMFELSHGGTLFLDEIGEMPIQMQTKLLRCIQENAVSRVGGTKTIPVQNRLICATNRNLLEEVHAGRFRGDLYYRINVLTLHIPPLRERKDDIGLIAQHHWDKICDKTKKKLPDKLFTCLNRYDWPGNIRELEAFIWRLEAIGWEYDMEDEELKELLSELYVYQGNIADQGDPVDTVCLKKGTMEEMQQEILMSAYRECDGNLREVARRLDLGYSTVQRKMKKKEY